MQYLLTQEELDALKGAAEVDKKVEERVAKIAKALEQVLCNHGIIGGSFDVNQHRMLTELRAAFSTK